MAITPRRANGLRKAIALHRLLQQHDALRSRQQVVLAALIRDDTNKLRQELEAAGILIES